MHAKKIRKQEGAVGNISLKERALSLTGSVSGAASVLGSWQICHNVCLGVIAVLGVLGVTLTGMPLLFLTKIAVPMWIVAASLLIIAGVLYVKKKCISRSALLVNTGLITAGFPFFTQFQIIYWITGASITVTGITVFFIDRTQRRKTKQ
jgi:hypothetical protein